jgi:hypothetical protein
MLLYRCTGAVLLLYSLLKMYPSCTAHVPLLYRSCTAAVPLMYPSCTAHVLLLYCLSPQAEAAAAAAKAQLPADLAEIAKTQGLRSTAFQAYLRLQVRGGGGGEML